MNAFCGFTYSILGIGEMHCVAEPGVAKWVPANKRTPNLK